MTKAERWAAYYAANKEKLKAKKLAKMALLTSEEVEAEKVARKEINKQYYDANRSTIFVRLEERRVERLVVQAEYRKNNTEKVKQRHDKYYQENKEQIHLKQKQYRVDFPERKSEAQSKYLRANLDKNAAKENRRRASKLNATPNWANKFFMDEAYNLAKLREKILGGKWHVDHKVPLKSKIVCGLHVEHNLRVIPAKLNIRKGNRHWGNMP